MTTPTRSTICRLCLAPMFPARGGTVEKYDKDGTLHECAEMKREAKEMFGEPERTDDSERRKRTIRAAAMGAESAGEKR